ncbi:MAG: arginine N-succinyltransferase [Tatlockia sp.]|jgi:arginine N-succinyltransferase
MMLFRSARPGDLDAIYHLAENAGIGLTTLPKDKKLLETRLAWSADSFKKSVQSPQQEYYLFVLEAVETGKILGTAGIEAAIGFEAPFYSYKIVKRTRVCHSLHIRSDYEVLSLVNDYQGQSELMTLYLDPTYRRHYNGLLLSRARFLFIAQYPARFASLLIAEMRGVSDEAGHSPFWQHVGQHFFHMPFEKADSLTLSTDKQFIADLMPRNPLYIKLLSKAAQSVIGKPHASTLPAMKILLQEGFRFNGYVDIFDAGPTIEAPCKEIRTIASSRVVTVQSISDEVSSKRALLANTELEFRATVGQVVVNPKQSTCVISKKTALLLAVKQGDCIRIAPLQGDDRSFFSE